MTTQDKGTGVARRVPVPWSGRVRVPPVMEPPATNNIMVAEHNGVRWINIELPTSATITYLRANFDFQEPNLEDVLDTLQRPKVDEYEDYLFLVVQFPVHSKLQQETTSSEVDIFVGRDYVITLHDARIKPLVRLFDEVERSDDERARVLGHGAERLLYHILDRLIDYCVPITRRIGQKVELIDEVLFEPSSLRVIEQIATVRRDIIATRRIIKPQVSIMNVLERRVRHFFRHEDEEEIEAYFGDLADGIAKIYDILDDAKEVVDALSATADSLISHRLNGVIKVLTIFSAIMLPLTLLASLYGMNTALPFANESSFLTFFGIIAAMVVIAILMILTFRLRRWL